MFVFIYEDCDIVARENRNCYSVFEQGSVDCLDLLLSSGANFRLTDNDNRLALHHAASQGHYPCVFTLVGFGSDSNAQDVNGATPLHLAAAASNPSDSCAQSVSSLSITMISCALFIVISMYRNCYRVLQMRAVLATAQSRPAFTR